VYGDRHFVLPGAVSSFSALYVNIFFYSAVGLTYVKLAPSSDKGNRSGMNKGKPAGMALSVLTLFCVIFVSALK